MRPLAISLLVLLALAAPTTATAQDVARLDRPTPISAHAGWLAWSARGPDGLFHLTLRDPQGVVSTPAIAGRATSFDVDLGPGPDGLVATYSRCRSEVPSAGSYLPADYDEGTLLRCLAARCRHRRRAPADRREHRHRRRDVAHGLARPDRVRALLRQQADAALHLRATARGRAQRASARRHAQGLHAHRAPRDLHRRARQPPVRAGPLRPPARVRLDLRRALRGPRHGDPARHARRRAHPHRLPARRRTDRPRARLAVLRERPRVLQRVPATPTPAAASASPSCSATASRRARPRAPTPRRRSSATSATAAWTGC